MSFALLLLLGLAPGDTVRYSVAFPFPQPAHHEARIVVEFPAPRGDTLEVRMSRSSPGRYPLHEFAKNVYDVQATDTGGRPLPVLRRDPYRWLVLARRQVARVELSGAGASSEEGGNRSNVRIRRSECDNHPP